MRIGQLAARTAIPVRTIRGRGHPAAVRALGPGIGLSLAEIGEVLRIRDHQGPPCSYVTELLNTHIRALETRIGELTTLRDELRARIPPSTIPDAARCPSDQICYLIEEEISIANDDVSPS